MRRQCGQSGMTLIEVLVTVAVILILIGALVGTGSYVKTRAQIDLTRGMLEVLSSALEQYYDNQVPKAFPFDTDINGDGILDATDIYLQAHLEADLGGAVGPGVLPLYASAITGLDSVSSASSAALFYFLDKDPNARRIASAVSNTLMTNKDADGVPIKITIGGVDYDLPRYIDPWKTSIRYVYLSGTAFPVLTSAGPDKIFDTPDDITSQ